MSHRDDPPDAGDVRAWWDRRPMTYGSCHGATDGAQLGTEEFFRRSDAAFLSRAGFASGNGVLLGDLVDYASFAGRRVLEIGCGLGAISQCLAQAGAITTALDLTQTATRCTFERARIRRLETLRVVQGSAEDLPLPSAHFDVVFSWGVLHHTPRTRRAIAEVHRVLKPGGQALIMVYHRNSLRYFVDKWFWEGLLHLENRFLDRAALLARYSDGWEETGNPLTRAYSRAEARRLFGRFVRVKIEVCGDLQVSYRRILPGLWRLVPRWLEDYWSRKVGWFLWIQARRSGSMRP